MTFAELLLKIATGLGGLFSSSYSLKRARRHDLAGLLERISISLISAAEKLDKDIEPTEECAELFSYTQHLSMVIRKTLGFWGHRKLKKLVSILEMATDAPFNAVVYLRSKNTIIQPIFSNENANTSIDKEIQYMKEAGGKFRAIAELIRTGNVNGA